MLSQKKGGVVDLLEYWKGDGFDDTNDISHCKKWSEILEVALRVIQRIPRPIEFVCGPISTGGLGNIRANMMRFRQVIRRISNKGFHVFNQLPMEDSMAKLALQWESDPKNQGQYCTPILHEVYGPLFEKAHVDVVHFIEGWEQSTGANWEWKKFDAMKQKGIGPLVLYVPHSFGADEDGGA